MKTPLTENKTLNAASASTAKVTKAAKEEKLYQRYASGRANMTMLTDQGKKIVFVNHQFLTDSPAIIAYLDAEIDGGLKLITKQPPVSALDVHDAEEAYKRKIIAEYEASKLEGSPDGIATTSTLPQNV